MKNGIKTINNFILTENHKKFNSERISFLSHVSHGIRTPLNAIMGFSKLLGLKEVNGKKKEEYIQGILSGGNLLLQFVDNIMDLSQFEAQNYSLRIRNYDADINLMLVWDSKVIDLEIETDIILLKKSLQRLINLVSVKFPMEEFELGYRKHVNDFISIYIRPAVEKLPPEILLNEHQLYSIDQDNSFDFFNYKVLSESVTMLGGELNLDSENQEFSFTIPMKNNKNNGFNQFNI